MIDSKRVTFQNIISTLSKFWSEHGCVLWNPHHEMVGAGTWNPATFLWLQGPEPWNVAYVEPSYRHDDGRFAENPNRMLMHHQYQVILKPIPQNVQNLYLESLAALGIFQKDHDIRFVEDNWESPAQGAWGLGWEVWLDGMEVTQYTYFQQAAGIQLGTPSCELTYGLERIAMYIQKVDSVWDLMWNDSISYAEILKEHELQFCEYTFNYASIDRLKSFFHLCIEEAKSLIDKKLPIPAYDYIAKCSNTFNILDTRGAVALAERVKLFAEMRGLNNRIAKLWIEHREKRGFPLYRPIDDVIPHQSEKKSSEVSNDIEQLKKREAWHQSKDAYESCILEIGTEELAASVVPEVIQKYQELLFSLLLEERLLVDESSTALNVYATPRRITAVIDKLLFYQRAEIKELKGPSQEIIEKNPKAKDAFLKKYNATSSDLYFKEVEGGVYAYIQASMSEKTSFAVLHEKLPSLFTSLCIGKQMRWIPDSFSLSGSDEQNNKKKSVKTVTFNRPIRWLCCLHGEEVIPVTFANLKADRITYGPRFKGTESITVTQSSNYLAVLRENSIILDHEERRAKIKHQIETICHETNAVCDVKDELLDELVHLVEYPTAFVGDYDDHFTELPSKVLQSVMAKHQRCIPLYSVSREKTILPKFIGIMNDDREKHNSAYATIRSGFEKVIRARLSDAKFFIDKDKKRNFESFRPELKKLTFHERLGNFYDKAERIVKLADIFIQKRIVSYKDRLLDCDIMLLQRASYLSKCDLATNMVKEMTSLQGEMGSIYAKENGEHADVVQAIKDQYKPVSSEDTLPQSFLGRILSLTDRIDTLAGFFAIGTEPTGSEDPFALRREALGIIKILLPNSRIQTDGLYISLQRAFAEALNLYKDQGFINVNTSTDEAAVVESLKQFLTKRLEIFVGDTIDIDISRAVLAAESDNPARAYAMFSELHTIFARKDEDPEKKLFYEGLEAIMRVQQMIKAAKEKGYTKNLENFELSKTRFENSHEQAMSEVTATLLSSNSRFSSISSIIKSIGLQKSSIDAFFDNVMVLSPNEEERERRVSLLSQLNALTLHFIDATLLKGKNSRS
jgi:glycyl-tRNA synthetase